ncbi:phosphatidate cytidylyltransferase [Sulfolobus acidocaldarius]|uniref:Conserved Archaeal membrane protein n=4 Tax=Sulfolobus acidocaldarius TaxID=2285 RepID=Q4JC44_SULAC|nr:phosphatidate cytidylyltransferase [Sulfolobus acidocaldarius]AAY79635.1 conserved Archaeal membrane protein [Sulfolobus acidocaldarius DSM 639]AGE70189.1 hypothetical protein SacN8_01040 [Sulfolobus acidocaldarius N8]AGE72464.1 hypothetical protein SacRon12I_01040 [Sulfolobus acidocaldarius Ron12/I]ALU29401.1 phosphatidate cytidylyltransferase [Sulfolobus acidocaldarius]ALU32129.1 phosphatidate cytidylyltransferase [Sulfolobus acidocaldarius]
MIITYSDVVWGLILVAWVAFVTLYLSKLINKYTNTYVTRKAIHILGGGVVAVVSQFLFSSPLVPIIASYAIMIYLIVHRTRQKMLNWFQDEGDRGEVYFSFSFGTVLLIMWLIEPTFWSSPLKFVPFLPLYYMSFGDGITGIIRNYVYRRRFKGFWGSVGMFLFCVPLGYLIYGIPGMISGVIATIVETLPYIDDNISVPFISFIFLYIAVKFLYI